MERYLRGEFGKYTIKCPFHNDRTPSAQVYPQGSFHCFTCLAHASSLVDFVRQLQFPTEPYGRGMALARAIVDREVGITTAPPPTERKEASAGAVEAMTIFGRLAKEKLAQETQLLNGVRITRGIQNPLSLGMGVTSSTLIPATGQGLIALGLTPTESGQALEEAGLMIKGRFRLGRRLFIPEFREGKVIFYQARAIGISKHKYINPPLPRPVYGLESMRYDHSWFLVGEGPFDVMPLIEAGYSALAIMGSDGVHEIEPGNRTVVIGFDRDEVGNTKGKKLDEGLKELGYNAIRVSPPLKYNDYSEWIVNEGVDRVIECIVGVL